MLIHEISHRGARFARLELNTNFYLCDSFRARISLQHFGYSCLNFSCYFVRELARVEKSLPFYLSGFRNSGKGSKSSFPNVCYDCWTDLSSRVPSYNRFTLQPNSKSNLHAWLTKVVSNACYNFSQWRDECWAPTGKRFSYRSGMHAVQPKPRIRPFRQEWVRRTFDCNSVPTQYHQKSQCT